MTDNQGPFEGMFEPQAPVAQAPSEETPAVLCPSCGHPNHPGNRHCASCGARVAQGPLPVAAQPMIRTTAGSRALIVTAAVIAAVIVIALLFNLFSGDDSGSATTSTADATGTTLDNGSSGTTQPGGTGTTVPSVTEAIRLTPNRVLPSAQLSDFPADNLIDNDPTTMWQVGQEGAGASLAFFFPEPVALERIEFKNATERTQFLRNFRIRGVRISSDDTTRSVVTELADTQDVIVVDFETSLTTNVRIAVTSTYPAESVDGVVFKELALEDIAFYGRLAVGSDG